MKIKFDDGMVLLAIYISTDIYQALHKLSIQESLAIDEVCEALIYYGLIHKCEEE